MYGVVVYVILDHTPPVDSTIYHFPPCHIPLLGQDVRRAIGDSMCYIRCVMQRICLAISCRLHVGEVEGNLASDVHRFVAANTQKLLAQHKVRR